MRTRWTLGCLPLSAHSPPTLVSSFSSTPPTFTPLKPLPLLMATLSAQLRPQGLCTHPFRLNNSSSIYPTHILPHILWALAKAFWRMGFIPTKFAIFPALFSLCIS